jgi:hypothetical protein
MPTIFFHERKGKINAGFRAINAPFRAINAPFRAINGPLDSVIARVHFL